MSKSQNAINDGDGEVIKFIGDSALLLFPHCPDQAVLALLRLKREGDDWLNARGIACRHHLKIHYGPMAYGEVGTKHVKRPDIFGTTVNTMFLLKTNGFAMTPQVFRKLSSETRKHFKKHTPQVTYIPMEEPHRD